SVELMSAAQSPARAAELVVVLDFGSNAARFTLARVRPGHGFTVVDEARTQTRLGGGLGGRLPPAAVREALRATRRFLAPAQRAGGARLIAVARAAVREARNADRLLEPLHRLGVEVRVLSGAEEGRLAAQAAQASLRFDNALVIDLGGGSLQVTRVR